MPTQQLDKQQIVRSIVKRLDVAVRSLRLYPPDHVICRDAVSALHGTLLDMLSTAREIVVATRRKVLYINDVAITGDYSFASALVNTLRLSGVQQFAIESGFQGSDLYELLSAFCMDSKELRSQGGLATLLDCRGVEHVCVTENKLTVVDASGSQIDAHAPVDSTAAEAAKLMEALDDPAMSARDKRLVLMRMSGPKSQLAMLLAAAATGDAEARPDGSLESGASRLAMMIPKLGKMFADELPDDRTFLNSNLAAAIMALEKPLRDKVMGKLLVTAEEPCDVADEVLASIPDKNIAAAIRQIALDTSLSPEQTLELMSKSPLEAGRLADIAAQIDKQSGAEGSDLAVVALLTNDKSTASNTKRRRPSLPKQPTIAALSKDLSELDPRERDQLKAELKPAGDTLGYHAALSLTSLLESVDESELAALDAPIKHLFRGAFSHGRFDIAALIVSAARKIIETGNQGERKALAKSIIRDGCDTQQLDRVLAMIGVAGARIPDAQAVAYFRALGKPAVDGLLSKLGNENEAQTRRLICLVLRELGSNILQDLVTKLDDSRWYLVRNVVVVIGSINERGATSHLHKPMAHHDPRVRFEVAGAASTLGGADAVTILTTLASDTDGRVRKKAIQSLVTCDQASVLGTILTGRDFLYRDFQIRLDICRALSHARSPAVMTILATVEKKRSFLFRRKQAALSEAARTAIAAIGSRQSHSIIEGAK